MGTDHIHTLHDTEILRQDDRNVCKIIFTAKQKKSCRFCCATALLFLPDSVITVRFDLLGVVVGMKQMMCFLTAGFSEELIVESLDIGVLV